MKTKHKNGKGKMEFRDGSVYTGEWKNNKKYKNKFILLVLLILSCIIELALYTYNLTLLYTFRQKINNIHNI